MKISYSTLRIKTILYLKILLVMSAQKQCWLKSVVDGGINIILQNKEEVILGRSPVTDIRDKRCSKNQVSLLADYNAGTVTIKHLGGNPSSANGMILRANDSHTMSHGEILEFLVGKYPFKVEFRPPPDKTVNNEKLEKRENETDQHTSDNGCSDPKRFCKEENGVADVSCKNTWERVDDGKLYIFTNFGVTSSKKIAAYDLDGTLILTKSGRVFPKDKDDWKIANSAIKSKLAKFVCEGYKIVIFTNQAGIGRGKTNINEFKSKIESIVAALGVPIQVFIATSTSIYRKPAPGMWTYHEEKKNNGVKIDLSKSFFVGDAAGRVANWAPGKKKDFSCADRLLALNLELRFFTPEEHFLNDPPAKFSLPLFNPGALDENAPLCVGEIVSKSKEVVIMVGYPGSGKSHFALRHLVPAGYVHVNRDTLGSWQKCVQAMESALASGRSVVVDNTNPDRESRKRFIDRSTVPVRCFLLSTSIEHVRHNVRFRELTDPKHVPVNDMIIHSYKNKFEAPSLEEGFTQIVNVSFVPSFSDPKLKKLYWMYLIEK